MKKRKSKNKLKYNTMYYSVVAFFLLVGIILIVALAFGKEELTGAVVSVKYYGLSDEPMYSQPGKIQTYVELTQPTLGDLKDSLTQVEVAVDIAAKASFSQDLVRFYEASNPVGIVPKDALEVVQQAAQKAEDDYRENTFCLKRVAGNFGHSGDFDFVIVTEFLYNICVNNPTYYYAYAHHNYYGWIGGDYLCNQESDPLFYIEKSTGKTSVELADC